MAQKPPDLDENLKPVAEKPPDLDENHTPIVEPLAAKPQPTDVSLTLSKAADEPVLDRKLSPEEENSLSEAMKKIWHQQTTPLVKLNPETEKAIAGFGETNPVLSKISGVANSAIKTLLGFTTPLDLETAGVGAGESIAAKMGYPALAKIAEMGTKVLSAPVMAHGASNLLSPDSSLSERLTGAGELAGGLFGMRGRSAEVPEVAPTEMPSEVPSVTQKPNLRLQQDGSLVDKATGEVVYQPKSEKPTAIFAFDWPEAGGKQYHVQGGPYSGSTVGVDRLKQLGIDIPPDKPLEAPANVFPQFNPKKQTGMTGSAQKPPDLKEDLTPDHVGDVIDKRQRSPIKEAMMLPKGIMASYDLSAPGRQGLPLIANKEWWTSWGDMVKSMGSEDAFQNVQKSIADKPLFRDYGQGSFAEKVGLHLSDLTNINNREEQIMGSWAEKLPGVRASNRAYTVYLNKLRADTFERMMADSKTLGKDGEFDMPLARSIAGFVNTATGRGSLGSLEKYATELNTIFFSPRMIASRLQLLNPQYYWAAPAPVRQQAIKSLFAVAGTGTLIGQMAKLAGGTVESDPTSSDFGKIKVGNTRIDPFGGFQQYIVAANRLLQNKTTSSVSGKTQDLGKKFGSPTREDIVKNFAESKLNPAISLATDLLKGRDISGKPLNVPEAVVQRFVPLFLQDLKTVATENPNLIPGYSDLGLEKTDPRRSLLAIPGAFGAGIQNYPSKR